MLSSHVAVGAQGPCVLRQRLLTPGCARPWVNRNAISLKCGTFHLRGSVWGADSPSKHSRLQAVDGNVASPEEDGVATEEDQQALGCLSGIKRVSWLSFWVQLALSLASGGVLFFTTIATKQASISTLFLGLGVATSLISTAIIRVVLSKARSISGAVSPATELQNWDVGGVLLRNTDINLVGMATTIVALQNEIGLLVAKTLASSSANPYTAQGAPAAIDIFAVQGSANVLMAHFVSLLAVTFLLRFVRKFNNSVVNSKMANLREALDT